MNLPAWGEGAGLLHGVQGSGRSLHTPGQSSALLPYLVPRGLEEGGWRMMGRRWRTEDGGRKIENEGWRVEDGRWRMENRVWRMESRGWKMEGGGWRMECGRWSVVGGGWKAEGEG